MGNLEHIKEAVGRVMEKCKCTMAQSVLGDGCSVCNTEYMAGMEDNYFEEVRDYFREDIQFGLEETGYLAGDWKGDKPGDWDMLAEYFLHE